MKKIFVISCFCMLVHYSNLFSNDGMYVGGQIGLNLVKDSSVFFPNFTQDLEFDSGFEFHGIWGIDVGDARVEGEVGYHKNDLDSIDGVTGSGDSEVLFALVNGYYDWDLTDVFTPYIGVGVGFANVSLTDGANNFDESDLVPVYQIGLGLSYKFDRTWMADLGYKLFLTGEPQYMSDVDGEYLSHKISIGLRYFFQ